MTLSSYRYSENRMVNLQGRLYCMSGELNLTQFRSELTHNNLGYKMLGHRHTQAKESIGEGRVYLIGSLAT